MSKSSEQLSYQVAWSEEDEAFMGTCLQFPAISWLAETREGAMSGIRTVALDFIRDA